MRKRVLALGLAGLMAAMAAVPALAASPEFARTAEEWARLQDDVLEYEEIEDLIHEYNPTVQNNAYEYQKFREDYGDTNDEVAAAYRDLADDLYSSRSGDGDASSMIADLQLETQAKNMQTQADNTLEDSKIYLLTYEQTEKNLAAAAQANMISYYRGQLTLEEQQLELEALEDQLSVTHSRVQAGMATELDVLSVQEAVENQEKVIREQESSIKSVREKLLVSLGWAHDAEPEICDLPEPDLSLIDEMDPQGDLEEAMENNYTLRINNRKLENAVGQTTRDSLNNSIQNNKKQIAASLSTAYQKVLNMKLSYERAQAQEALEAENTRIAEGKREAGMITDMDYRKQENTWKQSSLQVESAKLDLLEAMETYEWSVRGLAAAE